MVGRVIVIPMSTLPRRALRAAAFVRHVPLQRLARRVWLELKRRLFAGRAGAVAAGDKGAWPLRDDGFLPLPPDTKAGVDVRSDGFAFGFLGRSQHYGPRIDWSLGSGPAADQLWRMNLHYMEYLHGVGDEVFADLVEQWIAGNRPYGKGYWRDAWNAYALSIRTTVWMEELARRRRRLSLQFVTRLTHSLSEQLTFLASNLETDIGGNHLIKNIRALATGARTFTGPRALRMRSLAERLLQSALGEQVLGDGVHYERSPSYHNQVLGDLLAVRHALGMDMTGAAAARLDTALAAMAQASADLAHPDGRVAIFNDAGLHMGPQPTTVAEAYARLYHTPPVPRRHFAFRDAGYFGFRDEGVYVIADCGRLGPDALMAHAHGDALSFELSVGGLRMIVDQGVYEYVAGSRRDAARGAHSHNTLAIAGLEQADFFSAFRCGTRPDVCVAAYREFPDGFELEGWHDGFVRMGGGPLHRRRLVLAEGRLEIHDSLEGATPGAVTTALLLHPECQVAVEGGSAVVACGGARLRVAATVPFTIVPAVYWPDMGVEQATHRLVFHWPRGVREAKTQLDLCAPGDERLAS